MSEKVNLQALEDLHIHGIPAPGEPPIDLSMKPYATLKRVEVAAILDVAKAAVRMVEEWEEGGEMDDVCTRLQEVVNGLVERS